MSAHAVWVGRLDRPGEGQVIELSDSEGVVLGRGSECHVVLADRVVSTKHAELRRRNGKIAVRDLSSLNGTFVRNGADETRLRPGNVHELEDAESLRIGPFLVVPCARASNDVSIGRAALFEILTDPDQNRQKEAPPLDLPKAHEDLSALLVLIRALPHEAAGQALLRSMAERSAARGAYLFSLENERQVLLESVVHGGSPCLSQRFLEATALRERTWALRPRVEAESDLSSSLLALPEDTLLIGVPFKDGAGSTIALAYLEASADEVDAACTNELDAMASLASPILELAIRSDRAERARKAAEASLARARGREPAVSRDESSGQLVGTSRAFVDAVDAVRRAADSASTLLIRGESGTGKEELARLAHDASARSEGPFVAVNCATIPLDLVEAELFGHDKGAFTGADASRVGAFERAHGGTLFLDELGELSAPAQASLLRALETGEIVRVGGSVTTVDVRVIAATHVDLESRIEIAEFRKDLYYRLRVIEVWLPPLAERPEDILPLAERFLEGYPPASGAPWKGISSSAAQALSRHAWPGNIRELRNVIERASVLDRDGVLDLDDLPVELLSEGENAPFAGLASLLKTPWHEAKREFEVRYFRHVLDEEQGRVQRAAERAGVTRRLLTMKIRDLDLRSEE